MRGGFETRPCDFFLFLDFLRLVEGNLVKGGHKGRPYNFTGQRGHKGRPYNFTGQRGHKGRTHDFAGQAGDQRLRNHLKTVDLPDKGNVLTPGPSP